MCEGQIRSHGREFTSPIIAKRAKVGVHTLPGRILFGHHSPLAAGHGQVQDRVDHCSHLQTSGPTSWFGRRDQVFDTMPLGIRQISGIDLVRFHIPSLSHLTGCLLFKPALRAGRIQPQPPGQSEIDHQQFCLLADGGKRATPAQSDQRGRSAPSHSARHQLYCHYET